MNPDRNDDRQVWIGFVIPKSIQKTSKKIFRD